MADGSIPEIKSTQIYFGKADVAKGGHPQNQGRIKNVAVAQEAATEIDKRYGGIKNPERRQAKIDKFLSGATREGRGVDPFHAEAVKRLHDEALSQRDSLTGLLNTVAFETELADAFAEGRPLGIVRADLDKFSWLNDTLGGHEMGNLYLQIVASHVRREIKITDVAGRPGGDEFMAIIHGITSQEDFNNLAHRLHGKINGKQMLAETLGVLFNSTEEKPLKNGKMELTRTIAFREICKNLLDLRGNIVVNDKTRETAQEFFMNNMRGSTKKQFLENVNSMPTTFLEEMREYVMDTRISSEMGHDAVHRRHFEQRFGRTLNNLIPEMGVSMSGVWVENPHTQSADDVSRKLDSAVYRVKEQGGDSVRIIT